MNQRTSNAFRIPNPRRGDKTTVLRATAGCYDVYIGELKLGSKFPCERIRSVFANPFVSPLDGTPRHVAAAFAWYLRRRLRSKPAVWRDRIRSLKGLRLGCSCDGTCCHGQVLAVVADALPSEDQLRRAAAEAGASLTRYLGRLMDELLTPLIEPAKVESQNQARRQGRATRRR